MFKRLALVLGCVVLLARPAAAAPVSDSDRVLGPDGVPLFVTGINYEGPADRAWHLWDTDAFDPAAIEADFTRAAGGGVNTVRLFVQSPLQVDIAAGRWDKLDAVVGLAEKHGLLLIVSLHDYGERDLGRVSRTAGQVAERYKGRRGVLALDLKNEPRFGDLALTRYASPPPLQGRTAIDALGERLPRADVSAYRVTEDGARTVPASLNDDEAWVYVNYLRLYREMLAASGEWVKASGYSKTTLDYLADPAGQGWGPLLSVLNATLQAWIAPQLAAIRQADPNRLVTLDHVDIVLASLPANDALDVQSLHRYPAEGAGSVKGALNLLARLQRTHPKPYVLSEFGYPTETVSPERAALHETAIFMGLLAQRSAGGVKWMLNDMPAGYNMRERTLGAFGLDGTPKPIVAALDALHTYVSQTGAPPGELKLEDDRDTGVRYVYRAADAVLLGGKTVDAGLVTFSAGGPSQLFVTWTEPNTIRLWASGPLEATVDLAQVVAGRPADELVLVRLSGGQEEPRPKPARAGDVVRVALNAGTSLIRLGAPKPRPADYGIDNGHFFTQTNGRQGASTGFSVTDDDGIPFWSRFQELGGVDVLGYPVTRRFELDGFTVQAFQKVILQWRPERKTFDFVNTFDVLHDRGKDDWLEAYRLTPRPADAAADAGLAWGKVVARHVALLDRTPAALRDRFLTEPDWLDRFGLPLAVQDYPGAIVVRAQRATVQFWKIAVPFAAQGSVSVANGGDLAKEAGLFPWLAVTPDNAPR